MGKRWCGKGLFTALLLAASLAGQAQEVQRRDTVQAAGGGPVRGIVRPQEGSLRPVPVEPAPFVADSLSADTARGSLSLRLPPLYYGGSVAFFPMSYYGGYWGLWDLHEGFNATLGMSVSASFGKHRFPGVGFGTGISAMYVHSLTDRLVLGAGGFYDRLSWGPFQQNRFGINLLAGYKLTDRVSIYAYGSKAFYPKNGKGMWMAPMPWMDNFTDRFGGMLHFKFSDAFSFSVSVEENRWDK